MAAIKPAPPETGPARASSSVLIGFAAILILLVVAQFSLGSTVRITGSGDACPNWPYCFDSIFPPLNDWQVALEWFHRLNGALLGVVNIAALLYALALWRWRRQHRATALILLVMLVLVTITGVVGGLVVLNELDPALRSGHLVLALLSGLMAALALAQEWHATSPESKAMQSNLRWASITLVGTLLVLVTGSYAVWRGAGLVCTSWPLCDDGLIPQSTLQWIHVVHRLAAAAVAIVGGYGLHRVMRAHPQRRVKWYAALGLAGMLGTLLLGAAVATTIGTANDGLLLLNTNRILHISFSNAGWLAVCLTFASLLTARRVPAGRAAADA